LVYREQRCLPVVHMIDVRIELERAARGKRGPGEKREPKRVIRIVNAVVPIHTASIEILRAFDEIRRHPVHAGFSERGAPQSTVHRDLHGYRARPKPIALPVDRAVARGDHHDFVTEPLKRPRERARDVGEPPDLGERCELGRNENNFHGTRRRRRPYTLLRNKRRELTEILVLAAIAVAIVLAVAIVAVKLLVVLVLLPFKLMAALAGGIFHIVAAITVVCVVVAVIAVLPIVLPALAVACIAVALLG